MRADVSARRNRTGRAEPRDTRPLDPTTKSFLAQSLQDRLRWQGRPSPGYWTGQGGAATDRGHALLHGRPDGPLDSVLGI